MKTVLTVGSSETCDIVYQGRYIEPLHARLEFKDGHWTITDMSMDFGITINGDRILEPAVLRDNSHVKIATQVFHWKDEIEDFQNPSSSEYDHFVWQDYFSYKGTINRKTFFFSLIPFIVAPMFVLIGGTAAMVAVMYRKGVPTGLPEWVGQLAMFSVWIVGFSLLAYSLGAQVVKRARDTGLPAWKFYIPVYNLYLLFFK